MHKKRLNRNTHAKLIKEAVQGQVAAVVGAIKCLYWLCKQEIPHTTNYQPLLSLTKSFGCNYLSALNVPRNAHYASEQELVGILARQIECILLQAISNSQFMA